ncbi:MAG TPA: TetR-like C-terminal domain-containing protein [Stellaceae bacterium]|nr:TetR-like C-terminal domain-containing protein [Stellaceae bacterium]
MVHRTARRKNGKPRRAYRHGDLRRALIAAGLALAQAGGPEAVVLREATRRAGVVPNAAYRHFANRQALLDAVRAAALSSLAAAMEAEFARLDCELAPVALAHARLRAIGAAYLRFAVEATGLFRTAFATPGEPPGGERGEGASGPFRLLSAALDGLVSSGALPAARRRDAEYLAWSAVHGLAMLVIEGPLHTLSTTRQEQIGERILAMVENGL